MPSWNPARDPFQNELQRAPNEGSSLFCFWQTIGVPGP